MSVSAQNNTERNISEHPYKNIVQIAETLGWNAYIENVLEDNTESDDVMWFIELRHKTAYDDAVIHIYANFEKEFMEILKKSYVDPSIDNKAISLYDQYVHKPLLYCYGIAQTRQNLASKLYTALTKAHVGEQ